MSLATRALSSLIDLLAPRDCPLCEQAARRGICAACRAQIQAPAGRELDGVPVLAAGAYRDPLDRAIHLYKFESRPDLAVPLAALVQNAALLQIAAAPLTLFVPVPLHRSRLAERGYDQAALLAHAFAVATDRRSSARALQRVRSTQQQARLEQHARQQNVDGAFQPNPRARLAGRPVVLVDDVLTTGSTARQCVLALRAAGAHVVAVVCIALVAR